MQPMSVLQLNLENFNESFNKTFVKQAQEFDQISKVFTETLRRNGTIFWCGNGGSASEASHMATELIGRFKGNRKSLPSISLNADTTAITCIANDFGYDQIYSRQLEGLAQENDLLIVLSTSGNSSNIVKALATAQRIGITSVALLGRNGGLCRGNSNFEIIIESDDTARIQETHLLIGHTLCEIAELELGLV